jgi:hypothetical protein
MLSMTRGAGGGGLVSLGSLYKEERGGGGGHPFLPHLRRPRR